MTRKLAVLAVLILTATTALAAETSRYLVATRPSARELRVASMSADTIAERRVREFRHVNAFAIDLTAEEAEAMKSSRDIVAVEPVIERHLLATRSKKNVQASVTAPRSAAEIVPWGIDAINPRTLWLYTKGNKNVHIAVLDTGIDMTHPDLKHAYAGGYNFFKNAEPPRDDNSHGTHVAGTLVAAHNDIGVVGVAPNVNLWALKILDLFGWGNSEIVVQAIDWTIAKKKEVGGSWVANISAGSDRPSAVEREAILRAQDEGIIIVAAAGNTGHYEISYPAGYQNVIAVGAIGEDRKVADFSTFGFGVSVVAPGVAVESTMPQGLFTITELDATPENVTAFRVAQSPFGTVTGQYVECGYGHENEFPVSVVGRIALIRRGPKGDGALTFHQKVSAAKRSGAIAAVIYNDDDETRPDIKNWSLGDDPDPSTVLLTVAISQMDGAKLLSKPPFSKTITVSSESEDYAFFDGTSMSTPHVAGTVALMLSLAPNATLAQVVHALEQTTVDIETKGWDFKSAHGLIDAFAAAKHVSPATFGLPTTPPPSSRRRSARQ